MKPPFVYGIDFGTSNSALAILDIQKNEIVKLFSVPSLLFFPESGKSMPQHFVGEAAIENYLSNKMEGRFMKSVKRVLPNKSFRDTQIGMKRFTAEELVALIIRELKQMADAYLGADIRTAVIGRPVVFDENPEKDALAQERLSRAASIAGFDEVYFQLEPIGAAFTYERNLNKPEKVLVADFGGGTSDFTLMRLNPEAILNADRKEDMIGKDGIYTGGDNFDSAIMWEKGTPHFGRGLEYESRPGRWLEIPVSFFHNICFWDKMNFFNSLKIKTEVRNYYRLSGKQKPLECLISLIENNLGFAVFKEIEKAKIVLSHQPETTFSFHQQNIDFEERFSLEEFGNKIIHRDLDKILNAMNTFLANHQVHSSEIDTIFMTGGTSLVKPLQDRFITQFGKEKIRSADNFNSVAMGLAYSYVLFEKK
ncbi:MAG: Hsp70 family protein [Bacteroidia bacterium]|nr:Hsp70 family protein [Bacteroidia bacterium]